MAPLRIKVFYIASLVLLAILVIFVIFQPLERSSGYSEVQQEQLLQTNSEWIIQFDILNHEGKRQDYTINVLVNGKEYTEDVSIGDGKAYSFIYHIQRDTVGDSPIKFDVYAQGKENPIEQVTYHLKQ
ncbi:hypothetical protein ACFLTT_03770 [Chloroflexota bacterium]